MVDEMKAYQDAMDEVGKVVADSTKNIGDAVTKMVNARAKLHAAVDAASTIVSTQLASDMAAVHKPS